MNKDPFKDYIKESEPGKRDKGYAWHTAIGLQAVDGLSPSKYLIDTAVKNIEGKITFDEAQVLLNRNDIFAENSWYFRNALVRANYNDLKNGVHETTEYLELFLKNLLMNEHYELHNRVMHISGNFDNIKKADIQAQKSNIQAQKANIESKLVNLENLVIPKTKEHIVILYDECCGLDFFGRSDIERVIGLKSTRASELIKLMIENNIIESVKGHGKGKYRFK